MSDDLITMRQSELNARIDEALDVADRALKVAERLDADIAEELGHGRYAVRDEEIIALRAELEGLRP